MPRQQYSLLTPNDEPTSLLEVVSPGYEAPTTTFPKAFNYLYGQNSANIFDNVAKYKSTMANSLETTMSSLGYNGTNISIIEYSDAILSGVDFWGDDKITFNYKYNNSNIEFVNIESAPYPEVNNSGVIPFNVIKDSSSWGFDMWVRYDSSDGYVKCSTTYFTSGGQKLYKAHGIFIALQGAGGGGGEASCSTGPVFSNCAGGGGGGGGGFALCYVNLKKLGKTIKIGYGIGGDYGGYSGGQVQQHTGENGHAGGDSYIYIDGVGNAVTAHGGAGGGGANCGAIDNFKRGKGGSGGNVTTLSNLSSYYIDVIYSISGRDGGDGGNQSGWNWGGSFGFKAGSQGGSYSTDEYVSMPLLKDTAKVYREYTSSGTTYYKGRGQSADNGPANEWTSGGGGGGGSVAGGTNGKSKIGRGIGGHGGATESAYIYGAQSGSYGMWFILTQYTPS